MFHGFWVVFGWILTILETSFGFCSVMMDSGGIWVDLDEFGKVLDGLGWFLGYSGCRCASYLRYISSHIFQAHMLHLRTVSGGIWSVWGRSWMDLMVFGGEYGCVMYLGWVFGWFLDGIWMA